MNKYDKVFVVDVSFGSRTRFLFDEWKDKGTDVIWIDHHKTAIDDMRDYEAKRVEGREDLALRISIIW